MRTTRGALGAGLALLSVPLLVASMAWACSPGKTVSAAPAAPVPGGGTVAIQGSTWEAGPIEVRWQSRTGARLPVTGDATGPGFNLTVTIPDRVTEGSTYTLWVVGPSSAGTNGGAPTDNAMPMTITAGAPRVVEPVSEPVTPTPTPTPVTPATGPAAVQPVEDTSVFEPTDAAVPAAAPARSPGVAAAPVRTGSPTVAVPVRPAESTAAVVPQPSASEVAPVVPGAQSAGSDLWSGFATGERPGASLVGPATAPAENGMGTGLAVLGIGLLALMGGAAVALRRRPVKVVTRD